MSGNARNIHIFVKGNAGKYAYGIYGYDFVELKLDMKEGIPDDDDPDKKLHPHNTDILAILESLDFIKNNRGNDGIPNYPIIYVYTTFETNYQIANSDESPTKPYTKKLADTINLLKNEFLGGGTSNPDDVLKVRCLTEPFENKMIEVNQLLQSESHEPKGPK